MFIDYYEVLKVEFPSTQDKIKKAYRSDPKKWHPDVNKSSLAHQQIILIQEAYLTLSDTDLKMRYDTNYLSLKRGFTQPPDSNPNLNKDFAKEDKNSQPTKTQKSRTFYLKREHLFTVLACLVLLIKLSKGCG